MYGLLAFILTLWVELWGNWFVGVFFPADLRVQCRTGKPELLG